ncbi:MAG TPA: cytochrome c peroxidase [Gemmatimonadaceae bacterium]|nr:cytochrome c peroxidase [Gemmatimonadaceae bacterium]
MRKGRSRVVVASLALALAACERGGSPPEPGFGALDEQLRRTIANWGVIPILPVPAQEPALVELGRALFFDNVLSGNRDISCATCHHPSLHAGDGLSLAVGTGGSGLGESRAPGEGRDLLPRNAPSLLNRGLGQTYTFWDGRLAEHGRGHFVTPVGSSLPSGLVNVLAAQAMLAVADRGEMRGTHGDVDAFGQHNELAAVEDGQYATIWQRVMQRLTAITAYVSLLERAYSQTPAAALTFRHAANAIAAFQLEELTKVGTPFDRYLARDDAALTMDEKRGALLFFGEARCAFCHNGPLLGGQSFANVGAPQIGPGMHAAPPLDLGRAEVEDLSFYLFAFRVPPLRNVELTAPYMHSGAYTTLEAVVRHYTDVPLAMREYDVSQLHPSLRDRWHGDAATIEAVSATLDHRVSQQLQLSDEQIQELLAFLKALTDPAARDLSRLTPASVPSGLPVVR